MTDDWAAFERDARQALIEHAPRAWTLVEAEVRHHHDVRITARYQWGADPDRFITLDVNVNEQEDNAAEALALITGMLDGYKP